MGSNLAKIKKDQVWAKVKMRKKDSNKANTNKRHIVISLQIIKFLPNLNFLRLALDFQFCFVDFTLSLRTRISSGGAY